MNYSASAKLGSQIKAPLHCVGSVLAEANVLKPNAKRGILNKAMCASGNGYQRNFKAPPGSIALQFAWLASTVKAASGNAPGNHDSKSVGVQPMTRSNFSGTKLGAMGLAAQSTL